MGIKRTGDTGDGANHSGAKAAFRDREQYAGDFRIVGTVWKDSKTMLGYALMAIPSMKIALRPEEMLKDMLRKSKFENAELSPEGKIVNTECSMDRLFKFNPQIQVVANKGLQILAEIHVNGSHMGYRVLTDQGKTMDLTESTLLELVTADPSLLVNAKIVPSPSGGNIISAIKKPFRVIERERISSESKDVVGNNKAALGFQSRYIHNTTRGFFSTYLRRGRFAPNYTMGEAFRKKLGRFLREVVAVDFPATDKFVQPIYKVVEDSVNHLATERPSQEETRSAVEKAVSVVDVFIALCILAEVSSLKTKFGMVDVSKYTSMNAGRKTSYRGAHLADWNIIRSTKPLPLPDKKLVMLMCDASKSSANESFAHLSKDTVATMYKALHDLGTPLVQGYFAREVNPVYLENQTPQLVAVLSRYYVTGGRDREALARLKYRIDNSFRTSDLDFTTDVGLENLGLTLDKSRVGLEVPSTVYGKIKLKYYLNGILGEFDVSEDLLEQHVNCYGDLRILFHMAKAKTNRHGVGMDSPMHIIRFAFLAICNPRLAELVVPSLPKKWTSHVNLALAEAYGVGSLSDDSLLFYYSGGFFNRDIKLPMYTRWDSVRVDGGACFSLLEMPQDLRSFVKQVIGTPLVLEKYEENYVWRVAV